MNLSMAGVRGAGFRVAVGVPLLVPLLVVVDVVLVVVVSVLVDAGAGVAPM